MTPKFRQILLALGDILLFYLSLFLTLIVGFWRDFNWGFFFEHLLPFSILYLFWLIIFYIFGIYDLIVLKFPLSFYFRLTTALLINLAIGISFFYLFPIFGISPKTNLILNIFILGILISLWRKLFYSLFSFYFLTKIAIIGRTENSEKLAERISRFPELGYQLITFFEPKEDFLSRIEKEKIEILILAEKLEENSQLIEKLYQCLPMKIDLINLAQAYEIILEKIPISYLSQNWFLENLKERKKIFYEKIKRIMDITLAFFIILLTSPLWLLISLIIKLEDKGPILYKQKRTGKDRKDFVLYKFRSMIKDAEKEGVKWAEKEDKRITKVGSFLRKLHLDELPQMLNVLKGEISLVGPRPERPEFVQQLEKEIPYYHLRHLIKPGFTGWAQIKFRYGRSIEDSYEKFQYDLYYLKNRSLILDIRILLKTFQLFFKKE